jgi:transposase
LALPGVVVEGVSFTDSEVVVDVRRRARRLTCPCGARSGARYDTTRRRWRHLDLAGRKLWLRAQIARIDCRACGRVRTEQVPWARAAARHSRDFEDMVAWLAQRLDKTNTARLMRCSWEAVDAIVTRVVAAHINDTRLDGLYRIGVDEIGYKRGRQFLTIVADHDTGRVVWIGEGRSRETLQGFYDALGPARCAQIEAVTMDMAKAWREVTRECLPQATICLDPFHIIGWAGEAVDNVHRTAKQLAVEVPGLAKSRAWLKVRGTLRAAAETLGDTGRHILAQLRRHQRHLFRAWQLKEDLRELYRSVDPGYARSYLKRWCTAALRSRIPAMKTLARRLRRHLDGIVNAVQLGLSNALLEGVNARIRLIQRRGYGFRSLESLTAMIYLCMGGIDIKLPTET